MKVRILLVSVHIPAFGGISSCLALLYAYLNAHCLRIPPSLSISSHAFTIQEWAEK